METELPVEPRSLKKLSFKSLNRTLDLIFLQEKGVKLMISVLGSEEEARLKIYSVSTRHYYAIGAHIDEEICSKLRELPQVLSVNEDTNIDVNEKDYGGEPFVEGQQQSPSPQNSVLSQSTSLPKGCLLYDLCLLLLILVLYKL